VLPTSFHLEFGAIAPNTNTYNTLLRIKQEASMYTNFQLSPFIAE
jgi:hypothetical protein